MSSRGPSRAAPSALLRPSAGPIQIGPQCLPLVFLTSYGRGLQHTYVRGIRDGASDGNASRSMDERQRPSPTIPITPAQIQEICARCDLYNRGPTQQKVGAALSELCGHAVQLSSVANHSSVHFVLFGDSEGWSVLGETLKAEHVGKMQEVIGAKGPPMWYIHKDPRIPFGGT
ncbi:hypothetical protein EWM64_g5622 [Hericium alpestre]|uniref:Uncharacterized protein n=1 Tax=Hericium alpestre TaxID=135208 RepID=A0A4Y9ZY13_9AGAM|nr:hypothetical protein EWM64_g5622 [Hericium alpestre]